MALFFNLEILERQAEGDVDKFLALLNYHHYGRLPLNNKTKYKPSKIPLHGNSFILNPDPILKSNALDSAYLVQYIKLAGKRDYFMYRTYGLITLNRSYFPDLILDNIKTNPLLIIETNEIKFKYEEIYNGIKIWRNQGQGSKEVS